MNLIDRLIQCKPFRRHDFFDKVIPAVQFDHLAIPIFIGGQSIYPVRVLFRIFFRPVDAIHRTRKTVTSVLFADAGIGGFLLQLQHSFLCFIRGTDRRPDCHFTVRTNFHGCLMDRRIRVKPFRRLRLFYIIRTCIQREFFFGFAVLICRKCPDFSG